MIETPEWLRPIINTVYPPNNFIEYERWFYLNYDGDVSEREYLPIFFCAYWVNNNYGQDMEAYARLVYWIDQNISRDKKIFVVSQYDDGTKVNWQNLGIDCLEFNMSKTGENKYPLPLIGQPHPYVFNEEKKYLANFVGNITHPIREHAKTLQGKEGYYISFDRHSPEEYCRIIAQSHFTLCYRGYGLNSFRISEALQYGSTPVYISDKFIEPHNIPFKEYGIKISENKLEFLYPSMLYQKEVGVMNEKMEVGKIIYQEYYTYEGTRNKILNHLKNVV